MEPREQQQREYNAAQAAIQEAAAAQREVCVALLAHAEHSIGDVVPAKRERSGQPCMMTVETIRVRLDVTRDGFWASGRATIEYGGRALKADGTPGSIAAYVWQAI